MTTALPATVRFGSPAEIAGSVPGLLGFVPAADSAVAVTVTGKRVGMTARVDAPSVDAINAGLARELAAAILRGEPGATAVIVIGWHLPVRRANTLATALRGLGVPVTCTLVVQGAAVLDTCDGRTYPLADDVVRAAAILTSGAVVAPSREALGDLVKLGAGARPDPYMARIDVRDGHLRSLAGITDPELLAAALATYSGGARLTIGEGRDAYLCLTAVVAYLQGNGALARIALDACRPGYSLAGLLGAALDVPIPPATLRAFLSKA